MWRPPNPLLFLSLSALPICCDPPTILFTTSASDRMTPYGHGPSSQANLVTMATKEETYHHSYYYTHPLTSSPPLFSLPLTSLISALLWFPPPPLSLEGMIRGGDGCVSWTVNGSCRRWIHLESPPHHKRETFQEVTIGMKC